MDEQKLNELFKSAVGDAPPASFDAQDIATAAQRLTKRRRSLLAGGGGIAVLVVAVLVVLVSGGFGHTSGSGGVAAGALAPSSRPSGQGTFGHSGAGGQQAFADPRNGIAYAYSRRRFPFPAAAAPENDRLIRALYTASQAPA